MSLKPEWPACFDPEGSKTLMQDYLTAAGMLGSWR
jgi:hypothetical protein